MSPYSPPPVTVDHPQAGLLVDSTGRTSYLALPVAPGHACLPCRAGVVDVRRRTARSLSGDATARGAPGGRAGAGDGFLVQFPPHDWDKEVKPSGRPCAGPQDEHFSALHIVCENDEAGPTLLCPEGGLEFVPAVS